MSIIEHTTTITTATVRNMKRDKLESSLLLFANKSVSDESEITQLKAELELTQKQRDQAIEFIAIQVRKERLPQGYLEGFTKQYCPELYAHLAGRGGVMEFELKVGDVVQVKNRKGDCVVSAVLGSSVEVVNQKGRKTYWVMSARMVMYSTKTVHRPTPDGMVQVWPEVKS